MKTLKQITKASDKLHPYALHLKPVKDSGGTKYQVHAVGRKLARGIKKGEVLDDTQLDDATEIGAKIEHIKEAEAKSWFGTKKKKTNSVNIASQEHQQLQSRGEQNKAEGADEGIDYVTKFASLLNQHGYQQKLTEWYDATVSEQEQVAAIKNIKKNIEGRQVSTDNDTDIIRDYDKDEPRKQETIKQDKHHHKKLKHFRTYFEDVNEAISARMALSKAADMEFKAANTDDPDAEHKLKGKAKALRRAARLAQDLASTVDLDISKTK